MFVKIVLLWMLFVIATWMGSNVLSGNKTQRRRIRY